ncbi:MAG: bifunctional isocitrate dehydrogenase kinase/phosphatase, partial [Candidatus Omnitrophica bacterium]|nr:bifunctional isocitrate dehydrogenase kinase/phosphatase [Candidatus Omnitrophota bacterium]
FMKTKEKELLSGKSPIQPHSSDANDCSHPSKKVSTTPGPGATLLILAVLFSAVFAGSACAGPVFDMPQADNFIYGFGGIWVKVFAALVFVILLALFKTGKTKSIISRLRAMYDELFGERSSNIINKKDPRSGHSLCLDSTRSQAGRFLKKHFRLTLIPQAVYEIIFAPFLEAIKVLNPFSFYRAHIMEREKKQRCLSEEEGRKYYCRECIYNQGRFDVKEIKTSREVDHAAIAIKVAFDMYRAKFEEINHGTKLRFERRKWAEIIENAVKTINLYPESLSKIEQDVEAMLGEKKYDRELWMEIKQSYKRYVIERYEADLAMTFFYSVMRRVFQKIGQPIEYEDDGILEKGPIKGYRQVYLTYTRKDELSRAELIADILSELGFDEEIYTPSQIETDAKKIAARIEASLKDHLGHANFDSIEILKPVFYRNKGSYVVGRIRFGNLIIPLVISLRNERSRGIYARSIIMDDNELLAIFGGTRSGFQVEIEQYRELTDFIQTILPSRERLDIYSLLGLLQPVKVKLNHDIQRHLRESKESFVVTEGEKGWVMVVFTLPTYPYVFKVIADHSEKETFFGRDSVAGKYRMVNRMDRVGRMLNAIAFTDLRFKKDMFSKELLDELIARAPSVTAINDNEVILRQVYVERKVVPALVHLKRNKDDPKEIKRILKEFGDLIKDLAFAGIWIGDMKLKNTGITQSGRLMSFDYDELGQLTDYTFMENAPFYSPAGEDEHWSRNSDYMDKVIYKKVFLYDFSVIAGELRGIGIANDHEYLEYFREVHADLFIESFWQDIQGKIKQGYILDYAPAMPLANFLDHQAESGQKVSFLAQKEELTAKEFNRKHPWVAASYIFGIAFIWAAMIFVPYLISHIFFHGKYLIWAYVLGVLPSNILAHSMYNIISNLTRVFGANRLPPLSFYIPPIIKKGMKVKHPTFGNGRVENVSGEAPTRKVTVIFAGRVCKQILESFFTVDEEMQPDFISKGNREVTGQADDTIVRYSGRTPQAALNPIADPGNRAEQSIAKREEKPVSTIKFYRMPKDKIAPLKKLLELVWVKSEELAVYAKTFKVIIPKRKGTGLIVYFDNNRKVVFDTLSFETDTEIRFAEIPQLNRYCVIFQGEHSFFVYNLPSEPKPNESSYAPKLGEGKIFEEAYGRYLLKRFYRDTWEGRDASLESAWVRSSKAQGKALTGSISFRSSDEEKIRVVIDFLKPDTLYEARKYQGVVRDEAFILFRAEGNDDFILTKIMSKPINPDIGAIILGRGTDFESARKDYLSRLLREGKIASRPDKITRERIRKVTEKTADRIEQAELGRLLSLAREPNQEAVSMLLEIFKPFIEGFVNGARKEDCYFNPRWSSQLAEAAQAVLIKKILTEDEITFEQLLAFVREAISFKELILRLTKDMNTGNLSERMIEVVNQMDIKDSEKWQLFIWVEQTQGQVNRADFIGSDKVFAIFSKALSDRYPYVPVAEEKPIHLPSGLAYQELGRSFKHYRIHRGLSRPKVEEMLPCREAGCLTIGRHTLVEMEEGIMVPKADERFELLAKVYGVTFSDIVKFGPMPKTPSDIGSRLQQIIEQRFGLIRLIVEGGYIGRDIYFEKIFCESLDPKVVDDNDIYFVADILREVFMLPDFNLLFAENFDLYAVIAEMQKNGVKEEALKETELPYVEERLLGLSSEECREAGYFVNMREFMLKVVEKIYPSEGQGTEAAKAIGFTNRLAFYTARSGIRAKDKVAKIEIPSGLIPWLEKRILSGTSLDRLREDLVVEALLLTEGKHLAARRILGITFERYYSAYSRIYARATETLSIEKPARAKKEAKKEAVKKLSFEEAVIQSAPWIQRHHLKQSFIDLFKAEWANSYDGELNEEQKDILKDLSNAALHIFAAWTDLSVNRLSDRDHEGFVLSLFGRADLTWDNIEQFIKYLKEIEINAPEIIAVTQKVREGDDLGAILSHVFETRKERSHPLVHRDEGIRKLFDAAMSLARKPGICAHTFRESMALLIDQASLDIPDYVKEDIAKRASQERRMNKGRNPANKYPASMPTSDEEDRAPTIAEQNLIEQSFGPKWPEVKRLGLIIKIRPSQADVAEVEHKGGRIYLYVNPNLLRGGPETRRHPEGARRATEGSHKRFFAAAENDERRDVRDEESNRCRLFLRVVFEGHEYFHIIYPQKSEEEVRSLTIQFLIENNLLAEHIQFLNHNAIGLSADKKWLAQQRGHYRGGSPSWGRKEISASLTAEPRRPYEGVGTLSAAARLKHHAFTQDLSAPKVAGPIMPPPDKKDSWLKRILRLMLRRLRNTNSSSYRLRLRARTVSGGHRRRMRPGRISSNLRPREANEKTKDPRFREENSADVLSCKDGKDDLSILARKSSNDSDKEPFQKFRFLLGNREKEEVESQKPVEDKKEVTLLDFEYYTRVGKEAIKLYNKESRLEKVSAELKEDVKTLWGLMEANRNKNPEYDMKYGGEREQSGLILGYYFMSLKYGMRAAALGETVRIAIYASLGAGKTIAAGAIARYMYENKPGEIILMIMPNQKVPDAFGKDRFIFGDAPLIEIDGKNGHLQIRERGIKIISFRGFLELARYHPEVLKEAVGVIGEIDSFLRENPLITGPARDGEKVLALAGKAKKKMALGVKFDELTEQEQKAVQTAERNEKLLKMREAVFDLIDKLTANDRRNIVYDRNTGADFRKERLKGEELSPREKFELGIRELVGKGILPAENRKENDRIAAIALDIIWKRWNPEFVIEDGCKIALLCRKQSYIQPDTIPGDYLTAQLLIIESARRMGKDVDRAEFLNASQFKSENPTHAADSIRMLKTVVADGGSAKSERLQLEQLDFQVKEIVPEEDFTKRGELCFVEGKKANEILKEALGSKEFEGGKITL